jgi:hypothetical protein
LADVARPVITAAASVGIMFSRSAPVNETVVKVSRPTIRSRVGTSSVEKMERLSAACGSSHGPESPPGVCRMNVSGVLGQDGRCAYS